jgi:hypothetical protein
VKQGATARVRGILGQDPEVVVWALSQVELRSVLCRLWREKILDDAEAGRAFAHVDRFWGGIHSVGLLDPVVSRARRLLGVHPLRAADALQLAAALVAASDQPAGWEFVSLDRRLAEAARREGFGVIP